MRIVATLDEYTEWNHLIDLGADVLLVHTVPFTRNTKSQKMIEEIMLLSQKIHQKQKEIYLLFNVMIHEKQLDELRSYLHQIIEFNIDGFVCFDFSMYPLLKEFHQEHKMIYQPGTLTTNYYDPIFVQNNHMKGLTLSKEITLQNIMEICLVSEEVEFSLVGHGYLEMFYSRRPLLKNYSIYKNHQVSIESSSFDYYLIEEMRQKERYPIIEDAFGTTIYRSYPLHSFNEIGVISPYIKDFFIERIFLSCQEYYDAIKAYKNPSLVQDYLQKYAHSFDSGFYYRDISFVKEDSE